MSAGRRKLAAATTIVVAGLLTAEPASAHGIGGRDDLPIPEWMFTYGAAGVLIASFAALHVLWRRPRLAAAAEGSLVPQAPGPLVGATLGLARLVGLSVYVLVLSAAWFGTDTGAYNISPVALFVLFWVGLQVVSVVAGDVWRAFNPFETLALAFPVRGLTTRFAQRDPGQWLAAAMIFSFAWLELAYHDPSNPRVVALWLTLYSAVALGGAALWGRGWLRYGEGFAALFGLLAAMAPLHRRDDGRMALRAPLSGLATLEIRRGTAALVLVTLGSTTFDGLSGTTFWFDVSSSSTGWELTAINTVGLLWMIGVVSVAYVGATRLGARITGEDRYVFATAFVPSLVPIVFAYALAHYFSALVYEGQTAYALASDPYGRGWDLFGTIGRPIDYTVVSATTISWVQAAAIVIGHVAGVVVAHDKAMERYDPLVAQRSQLPLLAVMVAYTVGGLALLLGG